MDSRFSRQYLQELIAYARAHEVKPRKVKNKKEARMFTINDPAGHVWSVGEEYYLVDSWNGMFEVKV